MRVFTLCSLLWGLSSVALAHPRVDEGRRRFESADFQGALDALSGAEAASDLTRADLLQLLETRLLVYQALGDDPGIERSLIALASLDAQHEFSPEVSPDLRSRYQVLRTEFTETVTVTASGSIDANQYVIEARADHDPSGLVREVRVHGREQAGTWRSERDRLVLSVDGPLGVDFYAEARGPGGAVLVTHGSASTPLHLAPTGETSDGVADLLADGAAHDRATTEGGGVPWVWIGVGASVVAAVTIFAILASGGSSDERAVQPSAPMVDW